MADYEALRLNVGLNTDTAIKDARDLGHKVQNVLNNMDMGKLDSKTLSFIKNLTTASNRAQKLARDLEALGNKKIPTEEYREIEKQIGKDTAALGKLEDRMQLLKDTGNTGTETFKNMELKAQELRESLKFAKDELQDLVNTGKAFTLGKDTEKYKDMANNLNSANQATNILLEKYSEMTQADEQVSQGNEEVAESTEKATKATRAYGKTLGDVGRTILHSLRTAISKVVSAFKALARHLHSSNRGHNDFHRSLKRSLTTILRYAIGIRSIFMLVRRLRSTVSEAFKVMAQEIPEVNEAISTLGTSFKQLKATFGTMFQPLLQALAPILNSIIQKVTSLMNAIARFFATLTGQDYVYEATVANYDYAESVKEAQKANEGALASFDKLNVIAKDNAGKNTLGLTKDTVTYKKVKIDPEANWYTKLAKKIAEGWAKADLSEATHDIAEALANMLDGIGWEDIRGKTTKFAHTIATGINGITLPDEKTGKSHLAVSIGNTIAEALQTAIDTFDTFITDIDWSNLGKFIATAIESLKDKLRDNDSWRKAGAAFGHLFQGLVKLGLELLVNNNIFAGLGTDLSEFINSVIAEGMKINPETNNTFIKDFGIAFSTGFVNLLKEIEAFLDGSSDDLAEAVNELFQGIDLFEIAKHMAIVFIKGLKTGLKLLLSAGLGALGITVDGDTAEFLAEALGIGLLGAKIAKLVGGITGSGGLLNAFSKKDRALKEQTRKVGLETSAVTALSAALGLLGAGSLLTADNLGTASDKVSALTTTVADSLGTVADAGKLATQELEQDTKTALDNVGTAFANFTPKLNEVDTTAYHNAIDATDATISIIKSKWENANIKGTVTVTTRNTSETSKPETQSTTNQSTSTIVPTWKKLGYSSYEEYEKAVYDDLEQKKSFNPEATTPLWQKLGYNPLGILDDATKEAHKKIEGAPYYELSQQGAKAEAELREQTVKANAQKFEDFIQSYPENEQAIVAKALSDEMALFGYQDLRDVWESNSETDFFIKRVGRNLDPYSIIKSTTVSHDYLSSLKKGLSNLLKWLPLAGTATSIPIPFLAQGAVLPPNQPFLAMVGDQKQGTNVEAPLDTIKQAVAEVLKDINIKAIFDVKGDPNGIFKVVQREANVFYNQYGYEAFGGQS